VRRKRKKPMFFEETLAFCNVDAYNVLVILGKKGEFEIGLQIFPLVNSTILTELLTRIVELKRSGKSASRAIIQFVVLSKNIK
jgi:hypothetical protein